MNHCCRGKAISIKNLFVCARAVLVCVCVCVCVPGPCMRVRACNLDYPACNAHAPYCDVICDPCGSSKFFDIISETARLSGKKLLNIKCVLIFSTTFVYNIFHSKKKLGR